jgi:hypothetical protein
VLASLLVVAAALAGCGGGDDDGGSKAAPSGQSDPPAKAPSPSADAAKVLYEALGNAARQPMIRVEMHRTTFATEEDAQTLKRATSESSTVSELDSEHGDYRSAYATRLQGKPDFVVGRCVHDADYRDFLHRSKATSLAQAESVLDRLQKASVALPFSPCPPAGLIAGAPPDLAMARLSDGVFPVTLTDAQAQSWVSEVSAADLFDVTDEGTVHADGRDLRKLRLTPKGSVEDTNRRLYEIFYKAGDIARLTRLKKRNPKVEFAYEFISIGVANHGNVLGHYLIDPETELPVSSELEGTGTAGSASKSGWARTRQTYAFPKRLSLTASSAVELPASPQSDDGCETPADVNDHAPCREP